MAVSEDTLIKALDNFSRAAKSFDNPANEFLTAVPAFTRSVEQFGQIINDMGSWANQEKSSREPANSGGGEREGGGIMDRLGSMFKGGGGGKAAGEEVAAGEAAGGGAGGIGKLLGVISENPELLLLAGGGRVNGPGTGTSDSIPAWLSHGEFVVNAGAASKHGALLQHINEGRGHAAGGWAGHPENAQRLASGGFGKPVLGIPGAVRDQVSDMPEFNNQLTRGVAAVANFVASVKDNTEGIIESRRQLGEVSAEMASVFASKDVNDILMNIERGDRLSNSTEWAQRQNLDFQRALIPIESIIGKIENYVSGAFSAGMAYVFEAINKIIGEKEEPTKLFFSDLIDYLGADNAGRERIRRETEARAKATEAKNAQFRDHSVEGNVAKEGEQILKFFGLR